MSTAELCYVLGLCSRGRSQLRKGECIFLMDAHWRQWEQCSRCSGIFGCKLVGCQAVVAHGLVDDHLIHQSASISSTLDMSLYQQPTLKPAWQWLPFVWAQYSQTGLVSLTVTVKTFGFSPAEVDTKPLLMPWPPARGWHGCWKDDCVKEWFLGK